MAAQGQKKSAAARKRTKPRAASSQRLQAPELVKALLTVEEAAHKLSIGRTVCYRLIKQGELRSMLVGGARQAPVDAVMEYVVRGLRQTA